MRSWWPTCAMALLLSLPLHAAPVDGGDAYSYGSGLIDGIPPGPPPPVDAVPALAEEIADGLRCPVCQGLSAADSTSAAAVAMKDRVTELVAAGYDRADIEDYFVTKYGEWVLLAPKNEGITMVAWVAPALAMVFGLGLVATFVGRRTPLPEPVPAQGAGPSAATSEDPWAAALLAEVDDD